MVTKPRPNYLNHTLADGVAKVGFRKWYERELLSGHAHLVLMLLATVGMLGSIEAFAGGDWLDKVIDAVMFLTSAAIAVWAMRRYLFLLMRAEHIANQANCPHCKEYGRLSVEPDATQPGQTRVRCKACGWRWDIHES
jgi:hypothetical protein